FAGDGGGHVAPEKSRRGEAVQQDDGAAAVAVALHVQRTRTCGHAQKVGVYDLLRGEIVTGARSWRAMMLAAFAAAVKRQRHRPPLQIRRCLRIGASLL